jgi:RNA polymerase sigma factor (sigma-70 family)
MTSDVDLLARWRQGDRAAAKQLIERHFDSLHRFFRSTVPGFAEDLVQETWLVCVKNHDQLALTASFRAYILGIARNKVLMHWRTHGRRGASVDFDLASLEDVEPTPTQLLARGQSDQLLLRALRRIPLEQQMLLQLHYWEGMAGPELATFLGVPEGTVRGRLRRAKESLARELGSLAAAPVDVPLDDASLDDLERWVRSVRRQTPPRPT